MGVAGIWGSSAKSLQAVDGWAQTLELDLETREKVPKVPSSRSVLSTGKARSIPAGSHVDAQLPAAWGGHPWRVICTSKGWRQEHFSLALLSFHRDGPFWDPPSAKLLNFLKGTEQ